MIESFECVILRGLPGSGKSTFAKKLAMQHGFTHLEADAHFYVGGEYRFDPARAADAHALVARDALTAMLAGQRVVVANTHVRLWEMAAIVGAATLAQKRFCFVECVGEFRNVHAVPSEVIEGMKIRWEALPEAFASLVLRVELAKV